MEDDDTMDTPGDDLREVLGMPSRRAPAMLAAGQLVDDAYRIEEEIGAGGMGRVYRAHDLRLGRDVALKLHAIALHPDDDSLRREATALARLTHPNVVTVYEVGVWAGHPWVAMEYVPGGSARTWLRTAVRTTREILDLFVAAGRGLAAAHAADLVHRDFKPDNVLVGTDGRIRVADFGLARDAADVHVGDIVGSPAMPLSPTKTQTGAVRGTPAYMAPEQREGARVDATADQFAFAVSLWEALAGERPFTDDPNAISSPPAGRIPRHVEVALRRAMATTPGKRWPSMTALLDELARDPARVRVMVGVGIGMVALLVGGGYMIAARQQPSLAAITCAPVAMPEWSPASVRTAYPGDVGEKIVALVGEWTESWRRARLSSCEATHVDHTQSVHLFALRENCFERARAGLAATLRVLDSKVSPINALTSAAALPRTRECDDTAALAGGAPSPTEPAMIASHHAAEALIEQSNAWVSAAQYPRALAVAKDAVAYTAKLDPTLGLALRARAQLAVAGAEYMLGSTANLVENYEIAARLAAEAKDDALVADCYIAALQITNRLEKSGEVDRLLSVADTAVTRAGRPAKLLEQLAAARAEVFLKRGQFAAARPLLEQTITAFEHRDGASSPQLPRYLNALATALTNLQKFTEARAALHRAATIMEQTYGAHHPNLGVILNTLGGLEIELGDPSAAATTFRRALGLKEATLGRDHRSLAPTLMNLASALIELDQHAEAATHAARALAIAETALPATHPKLALTLSTLANAQMGSGDWTAAGATLERALAILEPLGDKPPLDDILRMVAKHRAHAKNFPAARAAAERAVAIARASFGDSPDVARSLHVLALVHHDAKDRAAARATLERAIAMLTTLVGAEHPEVRRYQAELTSL